MKLSTAGQVQELDRRAIEERGISSLDLMERAATGLASAVLALPRPQRNGKARVAVLCGAGNNGGDGIAAARLLFLKGYKVRTFLVGTYERMTPDALEMTQRLSECGLELEAFDREDEDQRRFVEEADVCIDALLGVGLSRPIASDSAFAAAVRWINASAGTVISADIASGIAADSGQVLGCAVYADQTVTFTCGKIGQFVGEGALHSGVVTVQDIGIPADLARSILGAVQMVGADFARESLPVRRTDGHKGDFGKVLVVGGTVGYTGAPYLTATAAMRTGCGLVFLGVPSAIWAVEAVKCTSAMPFPLPEKDEKLCPASLEAIMNRLNGCDVLALGPGLGRSAEVTELVCELLRQAEQPVVLDADGINALEGHIDVLDERRGRVTILTPHDGEFSRLVPGVLENGDRMAAARNFAFAHDCTLVLKGHRTLTATPYGTILVNQTGNSGLAKGGSGDVLTGVIASLLAQGTSAVQAAAGGVWLHGRAGDLAAEHHTAYGMTPEDVIDLLPTAIQEVL